MPDVVDKRTGKVVQSFGYTEQDRMEADSFASRSENYVVRDKTIRQPVQGQTRYTDSPPPLVPPRIDREGGGMQRYPTVPGGDPVAEMATEGQFQPVSPRTAQLATETGGKFRSEPQSLDRRDRPFRRRTASRPPISRQPDPQATAASVSALIDQVLRREPAIDQSSARRSTNAPFAVVRGGLLPPGLEGTPEGDRLMQRNIKGMERGPFRVPPTRRRTGTYRGQ